MSELLLVGLSWRHTPLEVLGRIGAAGGDERRNGSELRLTTCNRVEVLTLDSVDAGPRRLDQLLAPLGAEACRWRQGAYCYAGAMAEVHLLRVASGLDSALRGESQVRLQLARALAVARTAGGCGEALTGRVRRILRTATSIQRRSGLATAAPTIGRRVRELLLHRNRRPVQRGDYRNVGAGPGVPARAARLGTRACVQRYPCSRGARGWRVVAACPRTRPAG